MSSKRAYRPGRSYLRTVSSKGQIGLPMALRRPLGWQRGDKIVLFVRGEHLDAHLERKKEATAP